MAPQLQINQGPQDALLYDNSRSYFTNVGYTRTSNFQMELRDVTAQNTANLGATVNFVIPKAADLLGPVDLMVQFEQPTAAAASGTVWSWVESVGYAMIDRITFSVGSHDVEILTGENLNIINELMRDDTHRYGFKQIGKTSKAVATHSIAGSADTFAAQSGDSTRIISNGATLNDGMKLIVPLGLFFTKHPGVYFPLAAIAGCNDVRVQIKFKPAAELVIGQTAYPTVVAGTPTASPTDAGLTNLKFGASAFKSCSLRCHYVHVTGPEATALMNKEHVRLMKLWHGNVVTKQESIGCSVGGVNKEVNIDLAFLHPVQEIVITIRKVNEMASGSDTVALFDAKDQGARSRSYFSYHGSGTDPNFDNYQMNTTLKVKNFKLTLNGQSRHLDGTGIDRDYLMERLMPMMHSNTSSIYEQKGDDRFLQEALDRKEIYVYPFALNPEGHNPSGAVNFSKVSHARLTITLDGLSAASTPTDDFQFDVYGVYYNWLAIKDGRALTSFA